MKKGVIAFVLGLMLGYKIDVLVHFTYICLIGVATFLGYQWGHKGIN